MAAPSKGRVAKLESIVLHDLPPKERVSMILKAVAAGDMDEAWRIGHMCPRKTYTGPDIALAEHLRRVGDIALLASGRFEKYTFASIVIEVLKDSLSVPDKAQVDFWQGLLAYCLRAEWAGFDAFSEADLGLDAWTLLKAYRIPPDEIEYVKGLPSRHSAEDGRDALDKALARKIQADWEATFRNSGADNER